MPPMGLADGKEGKADDGKGDVSDAAALPPTQLTAPAASVSGTAQSNGVAPVAPAAPATVSGVAPAPPARVGPHSLPPPNSVPLPISLPPLKPTAGSLPPIAPRPVFAVTSQPGRIGAQTR